MIAEESLARFKRMLDDALAREDWSGAEVCIDRMKTSLIAGVAAGDAEEVARVGEALADAGELFELRRGLDMTDQATGTAWKLRADATTAVIAARIRPAAPSSIRLAHGLRDAVLDLLRQANLPLSNSQIAERLNRDAPAISRMLKALAGEGLVRQWKSNGFRFNALTDKGRGRLTLSPIEITISGKEAVNFKEHGGVAPAPKEHPCGAIPITRDPELRLEANRLQGAGYFADMNIEIPAGLVPFQREPRKEIYVNGG